MLSGAFRRSRLEDLGREAALEALRDAGIEYKESRRATAAALARAWGRATRLLASSA